ncbi:MAG: hypothetical protein M0R16_07095 [Bacteroidales bacterium]|jgi:hypothetical protein|nr:hypothetical protein [Bacteroidales bacterium]
MKLTLQEHIQKSREAVAANKAKGNRHAEFLSHMYARPSRFIEEIIQNTEDAYARKKTNEPEKIIRFKLFDDRIEIHHNGKDFDEADLMSLTTFANTTKKGEEDINLIGKFGIGFKSVFSITDIPEIHSSGFHYAILDYEILEIIKAKTADDGFNTLIILPFKKKKSLECYQTVKQGLEELNSYYLLFLKQISCMEISISAAPYRILKRDSVDKKKYFIISIETTTLGSNSETNTEKFLLFSSRLHKNEIVEIAYKINENGNTFKIVPVKESPVFVYFPTRMKSGLSFFINGSFTTNPLREYILFDKIRTPENIKLLNKANHLFIKSLDSIRQLGFYTVDFLSLMPLNISEDEISADSEQFFYLSFSDALLHYLMSGAKIPVSRQKYACASDVITPGDNEITSLLSSKDLGILFQKKYFTDKLITNNKYESLKKYFSERLQIKNSDAESFAFRVLINVHWLKDKNINWLTHFYQYLYKHSNLWDAHHAGSYFSLRYAPIMLTQSHGFMPAYDKENTALVFLPEEKKSFLPEVHPKLCSDEICMAFFKELGLKKAELFDDVFFNIIPSFQQNEVKPGRDYYIKIEKIITAFKTASPSHREEIIQKLNNVAWVYAENQEGAKSLKIASEIYLNNNNLSAYFSGNNKIFFPVKSFFRKFEKKHSKDFITILEDTGAVGYPRIVNTQNDNKELEGFCTFLGNISPVKSAALLKLFLIMPEAEQQATSKIIKTKPWIYTKEKTYTAPCKISISDISEACNLSESEKNLFALKMGVTVNRDFKNEIYLEWEPETTIENIELPKDEPNFNFTKDTCLNVQKNASELSRLSYISFNNISNPSQIYSDDSLTEIHSWSCKFVEKILTKKYPTHEIITEQKNIADLIIKTQGSDEKYIFVSGKTDLMDAYCLTVTQLVNLYKLSENNKYCELYLVSSAGTKQASVIKINKFNDLLNNNINFYGKIWVSF